MGFFLRWFGAFALLSATFNPTEWSYLRWATANYDRELPLAVLLGLLLAIGYIVYWNAAARDMGGFAIFLVACVFAATVWVLFDWRLLSAGSNDDRLWVGLAVLSLVPGVGLSWPMPGRRLREDLHAEDDWEE